MSSDPTCAIRVSDDSTSLALQDFRLCYCSIRKQLERKRWGLVTELANVTGRIVRLSSKDAEEFQKTKVKCVELREAMS